MKARFIAILFTASFSLEAGSITSSITASCSISGIGPSYSQQFSTSDTSSDNRLGCTLPDQIGAPSSESDSIVQYYLGFSNLISVFSEGSGQPYGTVTPWTASASASITLDLFTAGPTRQGIMVSSASTCQSVYIDAEWCGRFKPPAPQVAPFTLGVPFELNFATGFTGGSSTGGTFNYEYSTGIEFQLFEMNPDGSQGSVVEVQVAQSTFAPLVQVQAAPEPGMWIPALLALVVMGSRSRLRWPSSRR